MTAEQVQLEGVLREIAEDAEGPVTITATVEVHYAAYITLPWRGKQAKFLVQWSKTEYVPEEKPA